MDAPLWPTPTSQEPFDKVKIAHYQQTGEMRYSPTGYAHPRRLHLAETVAAMWPTPQARDYRSPDPPDSPRTQRKQEQGWSPNLNDAVGGQLNPAFVELLMGYPQGYTEVE
uniref:Uncharacterized protein n=1 Tax=viral metagenome TaxID=1070528 RepID=A0A6M3LAN4_9ZZZZ